MYGKGGFFIQANTTTCQDNNAVNVLVELNPNQNFPVQHPHHKFEQQHPI